MASRPSLRSWQPALCLLAALVLAGCRASLQRDVGTAPAEVGRAPGSGAEAVAADTRDDGKGTTVQGPTILKPLTGTDFLLPGRKLAIGAEEVGLPVVAFERLYLLYETQIIPVTSARDLSGHVRISTPEQALRYVRVFTSPATLHTQATPWWVEVVPARVLDGQFVFGRLDLLERIRKAAGVPGHYRAFGVLPDAEWEALAMHSSQVRREEDGFVVERTLFRLYDGRHEHWSSVVSRVAETVTPDGRISAEVGSSKGVGGVKLVVWPER